MSEVAPSQPKALSRPMAKRKAYAVCWQLRRRRMALNVSRRSLASQMGIDRGLLMDWEDGKKGPTLPFLLMWCAALGAEIELKG